MASISRKDLLILRVISISLVLAVCTACTPAAYILSTPTAAASATAVQVAATPTSTPEPTIPPTPTETLPPTPEATSAPTSSEFSRRFESRLGFSETYIARVGDLEIPIGIGLDEKVTTREKWRFQEVHLAPDIVDPLGEAFLRACHYRYTERMGNSGITFEAYLELLKNGGGQIEIGAFDESKPEDSRLPEIVWADPSRGFSVVFSADPLPVTVDVNEVPYSFLLSVDSVDGTGRLNTATLFSVKYLSQSDKWVKEYGQDYMDQVVLYGGIQEMINRIGFVKNSCLTHLETPLSCILTSDVPRTASDSAYSRLKEQLIAWRDGLREPFFIVVR